jgi:TfoX/Sxy family transcriptional regulator of competence genes
MIYYTESEGGRLREIVERQILHWPKVTTRKMFGCPAYLAEGKLFAFVVNAGIVITQIRKRDRETLAQAFTTAPFKAGEREISRWVQVTIEDPDGMERVMRLVRKSYETVLSDT